MSRLVMLFNHLTLCLPFPFCLPSFPASGSFPVSPFFASGGQSIGASASASVLPMNIQDWFPLRWTGWISLQSNGLSRLFNIIVQKHQFFSAQLYFTVQLIHPYMTTGKTIGWTRQSRGEWKSWLKTQHSKTKWYLISWLNLQILMIYVWCWAFSYACQM